MNLNLRPARTFAALMVFALASALAAFAQTAGTAAAGAVPTKVATLNVRQAIVNTAEGKQASAQMQSQFAPRQSELQNLQKQIESLQSRLNAGASTLSDEEKARLAREVDTLTRQGQRKQAELSDDIQAAQSDVLDTIGRKMLDVLDRYARENSYAVVLDTSAQNTPVIYGSSQVDVTQEIVRLYDQAYPIKAAPARPAAQPPAKKPQP